MDIKALIVEQLDWDGTLKTLRLQPDYSRPLIVAFPDKYAEPRLGPFHFLDSADEQRFVKGSADCKMRRLAPSRFRRTNDSIYFLADWSGIPTQQGSLTLYSLLLPCDAIPTSIHFRDPRSDREFRKKVYRDDEQRRYALYLECRSSYGSFDFVLETKFVQDSNRFSGSSYADSKTNRESHWAAGVEMSMIAESEVPRVQQFFAISMRDYINQNFSGGTFHGPVAAVMKECTNVIDHQAPSEQKQLLETLQEQITEILSGPPEEKQQLKKMVADRMKELVDGVTSGTPDRAWYSVSSKGLLEAAKFVFFKRLPISSSLRVISLLIGDRLSKTISLQNCKQIACINWGDDTLSETNLSIISGEGETLSNGKPLDAITASSCFLQ